MSMLPSPSANPLPAVDGVGASCVVLPAQGKRVGPGGGTGAAQPIGPAHPGATIPLVALAHHHHYTTVLEFLLNRFPAVSRPVWLDRMQRGTVVSAQDEAIAAHTPYRDHLKVFYYREVPAEQVLPFEETLVFQDDYLVVADKPHFMPVVPSGPYLQQALLVRLKRRLGIDTLAPVHRLDRDTAGLVMFTVQPATRGAYHALFSGHAITKQYEAIAPWHASVQFPVLRKSRIAQSTPFFRCQEVEGEPNAETAMDLVEQRDGLGRYRLVPVTGKKHQLRIHMAALGLPIVGDPFYPQLQGRAEGDWSNPLQLLAQRLAFTDPVTGENRVFSSAQCLRLETQQR